VVGLLKRRRQAEPVEVKEEREEVVVRGQEMHQTKAAPKAQGVRFRLPSSTHSSFERWAWLWKCQSRCWFVKERAAAGEARRPDEASRSNMAQFWTWVDNEREARSMCCVVVVVVEVRQRRKRRHNQTRSYQ